MTTTIDLVICNQNQVLKLTFVILKRHTSITEVQKKQRFENKSHKKDVSPKHGVPVVTWEIMEYKIFV